MADILALSTGLAVASGAGAALRGAPGIAQKPAPVRRTAIVTAPIHSGAFEGRAKEADHSASSDGARPLGGGGGIGISAGGCRGGTGGGAIEARVRSRTTAATGSDAAGVPLAACSIASLTSGLGALPGGAGASEPKSDP